MKSIFGLDDNVAAALSYLFGPFTGLAVLVMERENKFVRFHAMQSTIWFTLILIVGWLLAIIRDIPFIGWLLSIVVIPLAGVISVLGIVSLIFLMVKALNKETFKIPIIGDVAWNQINK